MKMRSAIAVLLLVMAMYAIAGYAGLKEIVFPEIAALALGAWVMECPPWSGSLVDLWLSPTLAALSGVLIVRYFPYEPLPMIVAAFFLIVLLLKLLRSGVLPSISAAILAIIIRCDSFTYPLAVGVMTGMIALGRHGRDRINPPEARSHYFSGGRPLMITASGGREEVTHWAGLLAGVAAVTTLAVLSGQIFMVAPPLIVAFVELTKPGGTPRDRVVKILALLILAAFSGVFWFGLLCTWLHWPLWAMAGVAAATVLGAYLVLGLPFPPALPIALLPTIIPARHLWSYPWQVLCGCVAFALIGSLLPLIVAAPGLEGVAGE